jgi:hypothetical protein
MAYTGKTKSLIVLAITLVFLTLSCSRSQGVKNNESVTEAFTFFPNEVPTLLSGIGYHTKDEPMNHPIEREFSWGKITFGYWNALVIDLMNGSQLVEATDGGGDKVTYAVANMKKNLIHKII